MKIRGGEKEAQKMEGPMEYAIERGIATETSESPRAL